MINRSVHYLPPGTCTWGVDMKMIAALLVSLRCTLIIDNSKHLVVIRIVIMTKCISGNRVGWRRFYCKTGRTLRKFGIRNNLRFCKSRRSHYRSNHQRKLCRWCKQTCPFYEVQPHGPHPWSPACPHCMRTPWWESTFSGWGYAESAQTQGSESRFTTTRSGFVWERWRWCLAMKLGFWKKVAVDHEFFTHLKRARDFTGSHDSISSNISSVK